MMASSSSSRAVLTGQRNNNTRLYVIIITIILLDLSISVESSIHAVDEILTARVGDTVNIPFEYCGLPRPSCTLTRSFNLSAPNPTCTVDRYGHCEVTPAPDDDPIRDQLSISCELCMLVIHGVTQKDAGRYAMCQTSGSCTSSFWSTFSTLEVEEIETAPLTTEAVEPTPKLSAKYTEKMGNNNARIFGVQESLTARVGETVNIPFEYCGLPRPSCTLTQSFNLSAPNPTCTVDRYGHCEVTPAPDDDPIRDQFNIGCELCVLVIHAVTERDAGRYAICQTSGSCTSSFWSTISTLKVVSGNEEPPTPTKPTTVISGVRKILTARVGDTRNIHFEYCGLPTPSCTLTQSFKLSAPNSACTVDRYGHGHCEVTPAPDDDPLREGMGSGCELCVLVVHGVTERDAGPYAICQTSGSGSCTSSSWSKISTLEVEEKETAPPITEAVEPIPKCTEKVGSNDVHINEKPEQPGECYSRQDIILTAVCVYIAGIATVAVTRTIRRVRKPR